MITGPPGAGTSEVALGLAAAIAARGEAAVLVDADELASSTAARLGLGIEPNLRSAIDAVEHGLGEVVDALVRTGHPAFDVVCGLPSLAAAAQIRSREVLDVLGALGRIRSQVLVEVSGVPGIEIARAVIAEAGVLVGVGAANPVGVARLLGWVAALTSGQGARAPRVESRASRLVPTRRAHPRDLAHVHAREPDLRPDRPSRRTRRVDRTARSAWPVHDRRRRARARSPFRVLPAPAARSGACAAPP